MVCGYSAAPRFRKSRYSYWRATLTNTLPVGWAEVRQDVSVKENVFDRFLAEYGDARRPGGGRELLMKDTLQNYAGLLERCPELRSLEDRIRGICRP